MQRILLAAAIAVLASAPGAATAQNILQPYVGIGISGASTTTTLGGEFNYLEVDGVAQPPHAVTDLSGHALIGATYRFGSLVVGIEGDVDLAGALTLGRGSARQEFLCMERDCAYAWANGYFDTLGHARAIVGYAIDPSLVVFAGAGAALADVQLISAWAEVGRNGSSAAGYTPFEPMIEQRHVGLTVGLGVEKRVGEAVSIRAELVHDAYAPVAVSASTGVSGAAGGAAFELSPDTVALSRTAVRASVIFGF